MTKKTISAERLNTTTAEHEQALADDLQLTSLLKRYPDFLARHPELLAELEVPHATNGTASLIERQVDVLRGKLRKTEKRMNGLMDIARDNERLAQSRQRLAINLLGSRDLDDAISIVLDELGNELDAQYAVIKLISEDDAVIASRPQVFVKADSLGAFSTMLKHRNPVCGRSSDEQKQLLFCDRADDVASVAVIPLAAGANLGLIGLGSADDQRFHSAAGTDFLRQIGELISASLAVHMEQA